jgi:hypothetical protein
MKFQIVTPYRVSHLKRYGVTVCGKVTSVYPPLRDVYVPNRQKTGRGFQASATLEMGPSIFWDVMHRNLVVCYVFEGLSRLDC